jgi:hypothetical protein
VTIKNYKLGIRFYHDKKENAKLYDTFVCYHLCSPPINNHSLTRNIGIPNNLQLNNTKLKEKDTKVKMFLFICSADILERFANANKINKQDKTFI